MTALARHAADALSYFEMGIFGVPIRLSQNRHKTFTRAEVVHDQTS